MSFVVRDDAAGLADAVQQYLNERLEDALKKNGDGPVLVALSGGSMPQILATVFPRLSLSADDWKRLRFVFADERHVPLEQADSNFGAFNSLMLQGDGNKYGLSRDNFVTIRPELKLAECAEDYATQLQQLCPARTERSLYPILDVVLLGMGPDGHTASLFPGHSLFDSEQALATVAWIDDSPKPPPARVTLTLPVINAAKHVAFIATGASKQQPLRVGRENVAIVGDANCTLPAAMVKPTSGSLRWFVDSAAVAGIEQLPIEP